MRWIFLAVLLGAAGTAMAGPEGVVRVHDADTIRVGGVKVRLFGIDAPEIDQTCGRGAGVWACGRWAAAEARARFQGKHAVCKAHDRDRHGRIVATCHVGGADMGETLVRAGLATAYLRYSDRYVDAEKAAIFARAGIFASDFVPPEAHRAAGAGTAAPTGGGGVPGTCAIKGNISQNGRIYHLPGQEHYDRTKISPGKGERWFCTEAEARAAGWRRARR